MGNNKYVAYYRKSPGGGRDQEDLRNSLSIGSQKNIVKNFLKEGDIIIAEYIETETGTNKKNRPIIKAAINYAKKEDATLLIANISRLARNVHFVSGLMDSGVMFKCCDMPEADNFSIHIFAAIAQKDAETISKNTKNALGELKKKGVKLGNPYKGGEKKKSDGKIAKTPLGIVAWGNSIATRKVKMYENENNKRGKALIDQYRKGGLSYGKIAIMMNEAGFRTSEGKEFSAMQVSRLANRGEQKEYHKEKSADLKLKKSKKKHEA